MGLLKTITQIFTGDSESTLQYPALYRKIRKWSESGVYANNFELPKYLTLPEEFWKKIEQLHKETKADGHERSISVFWAEDDWVVTSTIRGTEKQVTSGGSVLVRYVPTSKPEYFRKEILVDQKLYSKKEVYYKKMPKKIEVLYLFNLHTHPPHKTEGIVPNSENNLFYGFFSLQDVKSLLQSKAPLTGLVTDKLWLIFRTNQSPQLLNNYDESEIDIASLREKIKLIVYSGDFGKKMVRAGESE